MINSKQLSYITGLHIDTIRRITRNTMPEKYIIRVNPKKYLYHTDVLCWFMDRQGEKKGRKSKYST